MIRTRFRRIVTPIPVPASKPLLRELRAREPLSMSGQPPVVWDEAEGVAVRDRWGNQWLDWSSGVLVANAGHGRKEIVDAIVAQARTGVLHHYCFPGRPRAELVRELARWAPRGLSKVFLLTTGAEAVECAIKLARKRGGPGRPVIVSFENGFHGRTLGAQLAGGIPALKDWTPRLDRDFVQVPFPDGPRSRFAPEVEPRRVAAVLMETYQGGSAAFAPTAYVKALRRWCDRRGALLIFDEVQAGFGRTGRKFGFEHYGVTPDLLCCGKGISSGLPLSALIGRPELLDQYPPGSMTSTHSGNPVAAAASLANLRLLRRERLVENAARVGRILHRELATLVRRFPRVLGALHGKGLVAALHVVRAGRPDAALAGDIVRRCVEKGLLLFSPVGPGGACVKICPPLVITADAVREGARVLAEAIDEALR